MISPTDVLLLWDIDGTLVQAPSGGQPVYSEVFRQITGHRPDRLQNIHGKTDLQNIRELLAAHGVMSPPEDAQVVKLLDEAFDQVSASWAEGTRVLPGAAEALAALAQLGYRQGLLTGNTRHRAEQKLGLSGLDKHVDFEIGAFGSDSHHRPALVAIAQERAHRKHGAEFSAANTLLLGDTEHDVRAAREGGARVIGVATGPDSTTTLLGAGADAVLPGLQDIAALEETLAAVTG